MSGTKPEHFPTQAPTGLYAKSESALRLRADRVRRIVARMRNEMPWLTPADRPAMKGWAELEILSATVFAWLTRLNILNGQGEPRRLLSEHRALKLAQLAYERELGMTPLARATLKLNTTRAAFDLAAEMARPVDTIEEFTAKGKEDETTETGGRG